MNILFFLTPKSEVEFVYDDDSLCQVIEKMESHHYAAIPLISRQHGTYLGTVTARDILWYIKDEYQFSLKGADDLSIMRVKRDHDNEPVEADANMEDLIDKITNQNFVPVIDDTNIFIGIITRKDVINYLVKKAKQEK